jgi:hypothetical protein
MILDGLITSSGPMYGGGCTLSRPVVGPRAELLAQTAGDMQPRIA